MKSNTLSYLLVFALTLTLAATGCKKRPTPITTLPGSRAGQPGETGPAPLPNGEGLKPTEDVANGGGATSTDFDPSTMDQNREALAAYTVHFDYDSSAIKKGEQDHVAAVAAALQSDAAAKLLIEGHCDERGTEEYNRSLGERRALALREALAKAGIDPNRIRTISYGEDKPVDPGHTESAWKKNRRGEFVLLHAKQ